MNNDNVNLYAVWTNQYTISFNANGGSGGPSTVIATYGASMPVISTKPTRTGYTFTGYYTNITGGAKYYNADLTSDETWNKTNNATLYAQWTGNTYTVNFSANGGSGGRTSNINAIYGSSMPALNVSAPTRTGYNFLGYYDSTTGGTKYYNADLTSARTWNKTNSTTTLYARWESLTITGILGYQYTYIQGKAGQPSFYIGNSVVTQELWNAVMYGVGSVTNASWIEQIIFCNQLSSIEGFPSEYYANTCGGYLDLSLLDDPYLDEIEIWNNNGNGYRLATDAELAAANTAFPGSFNGSGFRVVRTAY
jgi:hypothetical protein